MLEKDQFKARDHLESAYQENVFDAHALLIMGYFVGNMAPLIDFNKDNELAKKFLIRCIDIFAEQTPEMGACYGTIGQMLIYGMGIPKDEKKGLSYLRKGEQLGHKTSSRMLDYFLGEDRKK